MKYASLFSGLGGFDIAAEWMNWEVIFQCENNKFCQQVLKYYWPNIMLYDNIKTTDFRFWRGQIDVLSGGPPCQPASTAGKRKGTNDDRWLWPEAIRAVREIKPSYVVFENPIGIISLEDGKPFEWILSSLEDEGYKTEIYNIPACGIEASHERQRIWFVAYSASDRRHRFRQGNEVKKGRKQEPGTKRKLEGRFKGLRKNENVTDTDIKRLEKWRIQPENNEQKFTAIKRNDTPFNTYSTSKRQSKQEHREKKSGQFAKVFIPADKSNFPTQSFICSRNDEFSSKLDGITFSKWRNESIKGFGNAIYPPIAFEIFKAIEILNL